MSCKFLSSSYTALVHFVLALVRTDTKDLSSRPCVGLTIRVNDLLPHFQSAHRRHHSTETALLRVLSDIYAATDRQNVTLLGLLDLSAAFDCVDHDILVDRLKQSFGICGVALTWIQSFLHGRTQQVSYAGVLSTLMVLTFGVPQGSVLGPLLSLSLIHI